MMAYLLWPNRTTPPLGVTMLVVTCLTTASAVAMATSWRQVVHRTSIVLWVVAGLAGSLGSFGNLFAWCWAAQRGERVMSALSAGMGAGALVPSLLSLVMDPAGTHPRFGVSTFFWIAAGLLALAVLAVVAVDFTPWFPASVYKPAASPSAEQGTHVLPLSSGPNSAAEEETAPLLINAERSGAAAGRLVAPTAAGFMLRMAAICWAGSLIFGWQPGLVPYLVPNGHPLVAYQIAGQVADVCGRLAAPWSRLRCTEVTRCLERAFLLALVRVPSRVALELLCHSFLWLRSKRAYLW
jgi:hypothetical protein